MSSFNKYSNGKIYTIRNKNDETQIYVGSTANTLVERMYKHKYDGNTERCKHWLLYRTINNDWSAWDITLHSLYPCNTKQELCRREGEIIREIGTLNERIAGRTTRERYIEEKPRIAATQKDYYYRKQDMILKQKKEYYIRNKENIREKSRQKKLMKSQSLKC
jgi:hypothetical protein